VMIALRSGLHCSVGVTAQHKGADRSRACLVCNSVCKIHYALGVEHVTLCPSREKLLTLDIQSHSARFWLLSLTPLHGSLAERVATIVVVRSRFPVELSTRLGANVLHLCV